MSIIENHQDAVEKGEIYPQIAKANLLRMRGDYKGAIAQCLSILKRYPDDSDAHTLIADIYAEQGDLGQSVQWYELALDLNPKSESDRAKLEAVQQRMKERDAASAVQQLGLPADRPSPWLYVGIMTVLALIIGIGAYMLGQRTETTGNTPQTRTVAISAPLESATTAGRSEPVTETPVNTITVASEEDRTLLQALAGRLPEGTVLLGAIQDPRTREITLTYSLRPEGREREAAAEIARMTLGQFANVSRVTLRGVRNGKLAHVATVERTRLSSTEVAGWAEANPGVDALSNAILEGEWPTAAPNPDAPVSSDGSTAPPVEPSAGANAMPGNPGPTSPGPGSPGPGSNEIPPSPGTETSPNPGTGNGP